MTPILRLPIHCRSRRVLDLQPVGDRSGSHSRFGPGSPRLAACTPRRRRTPRGRSAVDCRQGSRRRTTDGSWDFSHRTAAARLRPSHRGDATVATATSTGEVACPKHGLAKNACPGLNRPWIGRNPDTETKLADRRSSIGLAGEPSEMVGKTSLWAVSSHLVRPGKPTH
jgi:hypothetical protein